MQKREHDAVDPQRVAGVGPQPSEGVGDDLLQHGQLPDLPGHMPHGYDPADRERVRHRREAAHVVQIGVAGDPRFELPGALLS